MIFSKNRHSGSTDNGRPSKGSPGDADHLPLDRYERLQSNDIVPELSKHSQAELETIDDFERSNKKRPAVLNKLRYLRGRLPLPNYDALSTEEISAALEDADTKTLKRIRVYERKFQHRPAVLEPVGEKLRAARPAGSHRG